MRTGVCLLQPRGHGSHTGAGDLWPGPKCSVSLSCLIPCWQLRSGHGGMRCWAMFTKPAGFQPLKPSSNLSFVGSTNLWNLSTSGGCSGSAGWQKFLPGWCPLLAALPAAPDHSDCRPGLSADTCSPEIRSPSRLCPCWDGGAEAPLSGEGPAAASVSLSPPLLGW